MSPAPDAVVVTSGTLRIRVFATLDGLCAHLGLPARGLLLEDDLDDVETECDRDGRRRRDAEVICAIAANARGDRLDLGTSHGRSAFKLATNRLPGERVYTVNALPEQLGSAERHVTHALPREAIGSYFRARGVTDVVQFHANTLDWDIPPHVRELGCVFIDANHDARAVYIDTMKACGRVRHGGFLMWHDFNPELRGTFDWIDSVMLGVEVFCLRRGVAAEILHLRHSWVGVLPRAAVPSMRAHRLARPGPEERSRDG
jgi:hypothetical protein